MSLEFTLDMPEVGGGVSPPTAIFLVMDDANLLTLNGDLLNMEQP